MNVSTNIGKECDMVARRQGAEKGRRVEGKDGRTGGEEEGCEWLLRRKKGFDWMFSRKEGRKGVMSFDWAHQKDTR